MDGGGKYEKRERKRTENERERERRERGNNTLFLLFLHTLRGLHCYHFRNNLLWSNNRLLPFMKKKQLI